MTARTHDAIAFTSLITIATIFPPEQINILTLFSCLVANVVGGLLPDADQATNRLWDMLPIGNEFGKTLRKLFLHHRTITHSLLGLFIIYKFFWWLFPQFLNGTTINVPLVYWSFMIGYVSHLLADIFTKDGLPLLFPIGWKFGIPPWPSLRMRTGTWVENFVALPLVGLFLLWFIWEHQVEILQVLRTIRLS